tara:strand:- start:72377 stop:72697 length:321 start_codon:yes stop_codon:yes gene_type:complete
MEFKEDFILCVKDTNEKDWDYGNPNSCKSVYFSVNNNTLYNYIETLQGDLFDTNTSDAFDSLYVTSAEFIKINQLPVFGEVKVFICEQDNGGIPYIEDYLQTLEDK